MTDMRQDEADEAVYGMNFSEFKARHQAEAAPGQLVALKPARR